MSEGQEQSKRQRQKERRAAKREAQQRAATAARRRRLFVTVGVVVLVVAGIGALLAGQVQGFFERRALVADAQERLDDFGCTPIEEMPHLGAGHFPQGLTPADLAPAAPEALYEHRPTTSGQHFGQVATTGVYDEYVDERLTTHNLEHGYVVVWWDPELPVDEIDEIRGWADQRIDDGYDNLIAAPYNEPLPDGGNVAFTAWDYRQLCDAFDEQIADAFVVERHNDPHAPESAAGPHLGDAQGELHPDTDATVFAPFTDAVPGQPAEAHDDPNDDENDG